MILSLTQISIQVFRKHFEGNDLDFVIKISKNTISKIKAGKIVEAAGESTSEKLGFTHVLNKRSYLLFPSIFEVQQ